VTAVTRVVEFGIACASSFIEHHDNQPDIGAVLWGGQILAQRTSQRFFSSKVEARKHIPERFVSTPISSR
jgi:hypothetical protein